MKIGPVAPPIKTPDTPVPPWLPVCPLQKCVLYWPEKRGIYGKIEVLVNSVRECEHYTTRSLALKVRTSGGVCGLSPFCWS